MLRSFVWNRDLAAFACLLVLLLACGDDDDATAIGDAGDGPAAGTGSGEAGSDSDMPVDRCTSDAMPTRLIADIGGTSRNALALAGDELVFIDTNDGEDSYAATTALRAMQRDGTRVREIYVPGEAQKVTSMVVHGASVYFMQLQPDENARMLKQLYAVPLAGGEKRQISTRPRGFFELEATVFAADDLFAYVLESRSDESEMELTRIAIADGSETELVRIDDSVSNAVLRGDTIWFSTDLHEDAVYRVAATGATAAPMEQVSMHACPENGMVVLDDAILCGETLVQRIDLASDERSEVTDIVNQRDLREKIGISGPDGDAIYAFPFNASTSADLPLLRIDTSDFSTSVLACDIRWVSSLVFDDDALFFTELRKQDGETTSGIFSLAK